MSTLKNGVLLRNRKAESRPLMEVICSLLLFAPCLSALMISCCEYFLINVKLTFFEVFQEAQTGFEPVNQGVADPRLTTWLLRRIDCVSLSRLLYVIMFP